MNVLFLWLNKNELIFECFIVEKCSLKYKVFLIMKKFWFLKNKIKCIWNYFSFVIFGGKELLVNFKIG